MLRVLICEVKVKEGVKQTQTSITDIATGDRSAKSSNNDSGIPSPPADSPQPRKRSKSKPSRWFLWSTAFVLTAAISATLGAALALLTPLSPLLAPLRAKYKQEDLGLSSNNNGLVRSVNILVMGIDCIPNVPETSPEIFTGRSDTMLLFRLEPTPPPYQGEAKGGAVKMLSIPRDTRVEIPGTGMAKINQANAIGGSALAARVVSRNLNNVPIDRYIRVTTAAFRELVELVGGVEVFVPQRMYYTDIAQNLKIDLEPGWQTLNGEQAEQFARFRNDKYDDIGRVQRQQILLKSLRQRLANPSVLPRLPQLIQMMWKYVDTNLSLEEMVALVNFGVAPDRDDVKMVMLPGQFSSANEYPTNYWIVNSAAKDRVMQEYFQRDSLSTASDRDDSPYGLRIAIQNATGKPQAGRSLANYLKNKGFKNVYFIADWSDLQRQTQIIVQQGDTNAAITLKKVLGLGQFEAASAGDIQSDLTVRVGEDWNP